jgi:hypothetical protein
MEALKETMLHAADAQASRIVHCTVLGPRARRRFIMVDVVVLCELSSPSASTTKRGCSSSRLKSWPVCTRAQGDQNVKASARKLPPQHKGGPFWRPELSTMKRDPGRHSDSCAWHEGCHTV